MTSIKSEHTVYFKTAARSRRVIQQTPPPPPVDEGTIPRVSKLMALAIRFDRLIKQGEIADQADVARLGNVTRARVTQIMNLLLLAPDIQEAILFLSRTTKGRDTIQEHMLRPIAAELCWAEQRKMWSRVMGERVTNTN